MKVTTDACLFGAWVAGETRTVKPEVRRALDIGTGTGLLSLMLAQRSDVLIDAIEIDKVAAQQADENAAASPWKKKINTIHGDINDLSIMFPRKYDIIISNPPFYENELSSADNKKNIAHHDSGLLLTDLLTIIAAGLLTDGKFYLLLPYKRHEEIKQLFDQKKITITKKIFVRQSENHAYFRFMIEGDFGKPAETVTDEIAIRNEKNEYTEVFTELLKDYYLYM
jgi:tRNA1Val (adenine37-N6)-methyltransferase